MRKVQDSSILNHPFRVEEIMVEPSHLTLTQYQPQKMTVKARLANGDVVEVLNQSKIGWDIQDESIASILNGTLKGETPGTTEVTVRVAEQETRFQLMVTTRSAFPPEKEVTRIEADKTILPLAIGEPQELAAQAVLKDGSIDQSLLYTTDRGDVISVNETDGQVQRTDKGDAKIFIFSRRDARHSQEIQVIEPEETPEIVSIDNIESIEISPPQFTLNIGETLTLDAFARLKNGRYISHTRNIQWSLNTPGIINLDANGTVKAVSLGHATVTATSQIAADKKALATITVRQSSTQGNHVIEVRSTSFNQLKVDESRLLFAEIFMSDGSSSFDGIWSSSDTEVATVQGKYLVGLKPGRTIATVKPRIPSTIQNSFEVQVIAGE